MKTQKQLPELFYIQENEKTNEYCAKLAIKRGRGGLTIIDDFGDYLVFKKNNYLDAFYGYQLNDLINNYPNAVFVDLADYLPSEPTHTTENLIKFTGGMKELPKEFTFVCDKHSKEQLEKLGVDFNEYLVDRLGFYYLVKNNQVAKCSYTPLNCCLINLSDYIDQEQPEQKWQLLTRGGYEYHIYEEFDGKIFGRLKHGGEWHGVNWNLDGYFLRHKDEDSWDLLPINHELTTLEKELEEVRLKEKEILEKIEELKTK